VDPFRNKGDLNQHRGHAMTFIVEFRLKPGSKNQIVDEFEARGPDRNSGVRLESAWIGKSADVIFAIGESESEADVKEACSRWSETGEYKIYPVINIEQY
jgi:hypothetical protein